MSAGAGTTMGCRDIPSHPLEEIELDPASEIERYLSALTPGAPVNEAKLRAALGAPEVGMKKSARGRKKKSTSSIQDS